MKRARAIPLLLGFLVALCAAAQDQPPGKPQAGSSIPTYPDSPGGLKKLIKDILAAARAHQTGALTTHVSSMPIPDHQSWFETVFGKADGARLAASYAARRAGIPSYLTEQFTWAVHERMTNIVVRRLQEACDPNADEFQYPVLAARQKRQPFYEASLMRERYGMRLGFFAYIDGGFRYVGNLRIPESPAPTIEPLNKTRPNGAPQPEPVYVPVKVQAARLIHQVAPYYPDRAQRAGLRGTVRLVAMIGRDGAIGNLRVIQGHCWLAEAAVNAVKQWRYSPTILGTEPVEVITTIEVVFSLESRP